jgi:hypothetical protein
MSAERLFAVKEEMERAEARRLQPFFVRAFFTKALSALGGTAHLREAARYEITHVPAAIRERDRRLTGRNRREHEPVLRRYSRICFEREGIQPLDKPGLERAVLMHPGHPLMLAMSDMILEQHANLLRHTLILSLCLRASAEKRSSRAGRISLSKARAWKERGHQPDLISCVRRNNSVVTGIFSSIIGSLLGGSRRVGLAASSVLGSCRQMLIC